MTTSNKPVRTTVILGGLGGLAFLLAGALGTPIGLRPWLYFGIIWSTMAAYALLIARWSGHRLTEAIFPLLVLGVVGVALPGTGAISGLALIILGWIRSGICYPRSSPQTLFREGLLCGGGGMVLAFWGPSTPLAWALGIWLFSLIQALFFVLFEPAARGTESPPPDPFEQARRRIEELLDG